MLKQSFHGNQHLLYLSVTEAACHLRQTHIVITSTTTSTAASGHTVAKTGQKKIIQAAHNIAAAAAAAAIYSNIQYQFPTN